MKNTQINPSSDFEPTHIDYIRLASWETGSYTTILARLMKAWPGGWKNGRWQQYKGWKKESFFIGNGIQKKKSHTIINISGGLSQRLLPTLLAETGWYCTRIDVQITIEDHGDSDITLAVIRADCRTENTTLIESKQNDTLYLGSRTSEFFTRLYEKYLCDEKYLRLEFELKGGRARMAYQALLDGESVGSIFKYYLKRSKLPDYVKEWYSNPHIVATTHVMQQQKQEDSQKKLEWLRSLDSSIMRMAQNHDIAWEVKEILESWAWFALEIDNKESPV